MSAIRVFRPKQPWSASPATLLPTGLLFRLLWPNPRFTVLVDDHPVGRIGKDQMRRFEVEPGEHRVCMRFVGLRRSEELPVSLAEGEERDFLCGTSGMGWPTLREASSEDDADIRRMSQSGGPPEPGGPNSPS